jgi:hypothetical protein
MRLRLISSDGEEGFRRSGGINQALVPYKNNKAEGEPSADSFRTKG